METIFVLIAHSEGNPLVTGGSTHKGPVMLNFDISFVVSLNKLWNRKQSSCLWFDMMRRYDTHATTLYWALNSSTPGVAYMRQWNSIGLDNGVCLFGAKPLSEPVLVYCQLDP